MHKNKYLYLFLIILAGILLYFIADTFIKPARSWEQIQSAFSKCDVKYVVQQLDQSIAVWVSDGTEISTKKHDMSGLIDTANKNCKEKIMFAIE
ncbi:MAG: hypothetical protein WCO78_01480 [Candidatus Roizmanbacteria bacterium]